MCVFFVDFLTLFILLYFVCFNFYLLCSCLFWERGNKEREEHEEGGEGQGRVGRRKTWSKYIVWEKLMWGCPDACCPDACCASLTPEWWPCDRREPSPAVPPLTFPRVFITSLQMDAHAPKLMTTVADKVENLHVWLCITCVPAAYRGEKKVADHMELKSGSCEPPCWCREWNSTSGRAASA